MHWNFLLSFSVLQTVLLPYSFLEQQSSFSFDFETFPRYALIGQWAANEWRVENVSWGWILGGYSAVEIFCGK